MSKIIGMSRNLKLEWLNQVASLYISGKTEAEIKESLNDYLSYEIKSPTNLRKTREILMNIWVRDLENIKEAKECSIRLFNTGKRENVLLAHWSLMILAYPVFADICCTIGKMNSKMFNITNKEIKNKMFDVWGERSTLFHSIDKNISTLKDIGVLTVLPKNQYGIEKYNIKDENGPVLIAYTLTCLKNQLYLSVDELKNNPIFFPFEYDVTLSILEESRFFVFDKFGGEVVVSRK